MIRLYNTLSRKKVTLKARKKGKLNLFVCGITTYDFSHIGHARTYIAFDMIVKYLRHTGLEVYYLQNVTDVDDKIIQRAKETDEDPKKLARRFEDEYKTDMKELGVTAVSKYARATQHIKEIISQVQRLLKKEYAYEIEGDGIYFDISKFTEYGKLSHRTSQQAQDATSRIDESVQKRNKGDFALWKISKPGEPTWKSPWGEGRPGWHIEDTAITEKAFGAQYDVHGGAQDLIFPHHEAEVTQMEAVSGKKPFVKYWLHTGFLTVNGEKMSKSLGNFITIQDFLEKHSPRLLRYAVLKAQYRSPIDYSEKLLLQAQSELDKIDEFTDRLREKRKLEVEKSKKYKIKSVISKFEKAMQDDFNTPLALSVLFDLVKDGNKLLDEKKMTKQDQKDILAFLKDIDTFFGFIFWGREDIRIPAEITVLAEKRQKLREDGNFAEADMLRQKLSQQGWLVEDTPTGWKLKKLVYRK